MHYPKHAKVRMQQRGIPQDVVELVITYGERAPARRRGEIFYLGNKGRKRARRVLGAERARKLQQYFRTAVIVENGEVKTCVKWDRRIRRG